MDWQGICFLGLIIAGATIAVWRSTPRARKWVMLVIGLPGTVLIWRWTAYRRAWTGLALGIGLALLLAGWWGFIGRHLQPPSENSIRVCTKDDPF
jgi:hypothetical protein